jgi:hypothetical protein
LVDLLRGVFGDVGDDAANDPELLDARVRWAALGEALAADDPEGAAAILQMDRERLLRCVGRQHGALASLLGGEPVDDLPRQLGVRTDPVGGRVLYELGVDGAFVLHVRGAASRLSGLAVGLIEGLVASTGDDAAIEVQRTSGASVAIHVTPVPVGRTGAHAPDRSGR